MKANTEMRADSLQVTARGDLPFVISGLQTNLDELNNDCSGQLPLDQEGKFTTAQLDDIYDLCAPHGVVVDEDYLRKLNQLRAGIERWTAIKADWDAVLCASMEAASKYFFSRFWALYSSFFFFLCPKLLNLQNTFSM